MGQKLKAPNDDTKQWQGFVLAGKMNKGMQH